MPSLTNLGRFSRVRLFDYDVFDRIVYLQLPRANGPLNASPHLHPILVRSLAAAARASGASAGSGVPLTI